mmetsp:Transcript_10495/g.29500  ORF Transcript_10495/g.29500 Transcript_10495/m.29500 type:complete len:101 (+) Transcript_10495:784-1086(+)
MQACTSRDALLVVVLVMMDRISQLRKLYGVKMDLIVLFVGRTLELIAYRAMSITQRSANIKTERAQSKRMNAQRRLKDAMSATRTTSNVMLVRRVAYIAH